MKIVIIGSRGFIGHNLENYFKHIGYEVYGCDIINSINQENYIKIDADNPNYELLFKNDPYNVCINASGAANVLKSFSDTIPDFYSNTFNVIKILEAIRRFNPDCRFLNLSSAAVYGNPLSLPTHEKSILSPLSPYGYHKLIAETILDEYHTLWHIKTCSVRIFSAYGKGLRKQLLYDISRKILTEQEVHLFGTGKETRDFIHIDDICFALDCIIKKDTFQSSKINVANGEEISISNIVAIFNDIWKHTKKIIFDGIEKPGDPINWRADISILRSYGYRQKISIYDGVKRYIQWIQNEKLE